MEKNLLYYYQSGSFNKYFKTLKVNKVDYKTQNKTLLKKLIKKQIKNTGWERHVFLVDIYISENNNICCHFQSAYFNDFYVDIEEFKVLKKKIGTMDYQLNFIFNTDKFK